MGAFQLRNEIRQSVRDAIRNAAQEARDAAQATREGGQHVRDAEQQVREANQAVRDANASMRGASTPQEHAAAARQLVSAQAELASAQAELASAEAQLETATRAYTVQLPRDFQRAIPTGAVDITVAFFVTCAVMVIGRPIARAVGRRIERGGGAPALSPDATASIKRIEQTMDAMSIEVERISEAQRYMVKLRADSPR